MDRYYKEQLRLLREEAAHFARLHPALAPMILTRGEDPDVERILEGTAYLCGKIHERMDQGTPELVQALMRLTFPQALLPVPSTTLMRFQLSPGFGQALHVPQGTEMAATPVEGVACRYSTTAPLTILPLDIRPLPAGPPSGAFLRAGLAMQGAAPLRTFLGRDLLLHLHGEYGMAVQRFFALLTRLDHLEISFTSGTPGAAGATDGTGRVVRLPASALRHTPFPLEDCRLPRSLRRNRSYMELIRYFSLPQQLLFVTLTGLDRLSIPEDATRMEVCFFLKKPFEDLPDFNADWAMVNVVPAMNVFALSAEPLVVDHTQEEYLVRPRDAQDTHLEICSVDKVSALLPGGVIEPCAAYETASANTGRRLYGLRIRPSGPGRGLEGSTEHLLTFLHHPGEKPENLVRQTLSMELLCCHLALPSSLRAGDINRPTDSSPAQAVFSNITTPTPTLPRIVDESLLWRFLSHLNTNILSCESAESLRSMLELYIPDEAAAPEQAAANRRRCSGISAFFGSMEDMLFRGNLLRGRGLHLTLEPSAFISPGDMFLFASTLDRFLAGYATVNSYFRLTLSVTGVGEVHQWPPRLGEKQLL